MPEAPKQLSEFKARVDSLAAIIDAPTDDLPTYGRTSDFARPHIEFNEGEYHFVVVERGEELERISSAKPEEILYHIFQGISFSMACDHEKRHRRTHEDVRRQLFARQLEILSELSGEWRDRAAHEHVKTLDRHPFNDAVND